MKMQKERWGRESGRGSDAKTSGIQFGEGRVEGVGWMDVNQELKL